MVHIHNAKIAQNKPDPDQDSIVLNADPVVIKIINIITGS